MATPLVSVCMTTYNHEKYLAQAIEGVLAQQTSFGVELLLGEDCSTDSTPEICRAYAEKYPNCIRIISSEHNVGWRANYRRTIAAAQGKYIAMCDGDDLWSDAEKLEQQVKYMEENPSCGMCYTRSERVDEALGIRTIYPPQEGHEDLRSMLHLNTAENCTTVARKDLIEQYYAEIRPDLHPEWQTDDLPMWLWFAANSQIKFIDRITAVHRIVSGSVSHSRDYHKGIAFCDSLYNIMLWYNERYNAGERYTICRKAHREAMWSLSQNGTCSELWSRWKSDIRRTPHLLLSLDALKIIIKKRILKL